MFLKKKKGNNDIIIELGQRQADLKFAVLDE